MPLLKVCFTLPGSRRRLCVHIQGISGRRLNVPPSPDLIEIDGKQQSWASDAEVLATVENVASAATPALKRMLRETVAKGISAISNGLPQGVTISRTG